MPILVSDGGDRCVLCYVWPGLLRMMVLERKFSCGHETRRQGLGDENDSGERRNVRPDLWGTVE